MATEMALWHLTMAAYFLANIDSFILEVSLLAIGKFKKLAVILGYFIAAMVILALTIVFSIASKRMIPSQYLNYLGLIPLLMGVYSFTSAFLCHGMSKEVKPVNGQEAQQKFLSQLSLNVFTQLSCSIDNVVLFFPILAYHHSDLGYTIFSSVFMVMAIVFSFLPLVVYRFLNTQQVQKYNHWIFPGFLILLGFYILF
jgi:cadmium resistance protein CadD (predicted permease)